MARPSSTAASAAASASAAAASAAAAPAAADDAAPVPGWELMQAKTFMKWCNIYLEKRAMSIASIESDWDDGVKLINLLEVGGRWRVAAVIAWQREGCGGC